MWSQAVIPPPPKTVFFNHPLQLQQLKSKKRGKKQNKTIIKSTGHGDKKGYVFCAQGGDN